MSKQSYHWIRLDNDYKKKIDVISENFLEDGRSSASNQTGTIRYLIDDKYIDILQNK